MNATIAERVPNYVPLEQLEAGLEVIRQAPKDGGILQLIVARPGTDQRQVLTEGRLDLHVGLEGDNWKTRGSSKTPDGSANPAMQLTLMNARVIALVAEDKEFWPLAGDQLFVDFDLSQQNIPPGTQIQIGSALIEVSIPPHTGCKKFAARFGAEATKFINSPEGRTLQMRGINAKVVKPGMVKVGDIVRKMPPSPA